MRSIATALVLTLCAPQPLASLIPERSSTAFVHLFEWNWPDVARECEEWLGPKGFNAVQISPPNDHIQGTQWWTRYQPVTYNLTSRSGDESEFIDMVKRCQKSGVGVYADAVINHIAAGSGTSIAGNDYGNRATPIYTADEMHHAAGDNSRNCAVNNYHDKFNVQYCDLVGLPDLCTGCKSVQKRIVAYLNKMADIGIAGIRIDAAKHQDAHELDGILAGINGLYNFQEVISGSGEAVTPNQYFSLGQVTEFNYARQLAPNIIQDGKLQYLGNFGEAWGFMPSRSAVVFMDNHDTQRGEAPLTYKNGKLYQLANIFMLAHPYGYPKVMSSYFFSSHDQGPPRQHVHAGTSVACASGPSGLTHNSSNNDDTPWVCEHRWLPIANMIAWRKSAGSNGVSHFQALGGDTIAFCRGATACIALNRQQSATWSVNLIFSLPAGLYCNIIQSDDTSSCQKIQVSGDGSVTLQVPPLSAVALHTGKKIGDAEMVV